ncbi:MULTISPECIES: hypothetical protein [Klebsiella/Raoultella group]|uniref:hypothetical protein n=1 Tax=Klebsiella/Raoultella group TaxID=2890311 RepID=UPI00164BA681|nr:MULTISPECIES: hypothetical protein [Klebsiella/Raoultella group]MBC4754939.1 hypothetical protein [Klebsiella variicola]MDV1448276.1 hypothetical protein [Raoultella planticola]MDV1564000.1 hypothetical protein [Raoultella planticola]MDV1570578.1 hypothetical protein [Raoultella planticola]MDV1630859.1 hypothetical protein [Raoultella planticola]
MTDMFTALQTAISTAEKLTNSSSITAADKAKAATLLAALKNYKGIAFSLRDYSITDTAA